MARRKRNAPIELWRGFEIDRLIASGTYPNVQTLMKRFEVSEATIIRDIDRLRYDFNAPIEYDRFKKGYYYTNPMFRIPAGLTTEKQIVAAQLVSNLLETLKGSPIYAQAVEVFVSLATNLDSPDEKDRAKRLSNRVVFLDMQQVSVSDEIWEKLENALAENRYITFEYAYYDDRPPVSFTVAPWQLLHYHGMWTLYAFITKYQETRLFNLPLIKNVQILKETFELPEDFAFEKKSIGHFGKYIAKETYEFKIRITSFYALNYIATYNWADDQKFEKQDDGSTIWTFTSNQLFPVFNLVMSQGQWMTPLAPKELMDLWKENVKKMAENLKNNSGEK